MDLSRNKTFFVFFFLTSFSSVLFSSRLVFVHHVSLSPLFHFLLCLIFDFLDLSFSWTRFFFWTTISLLNKKKLFNLSFFTRMRSALCPLLIHLFICCLFFSLRFFRFDHMCFPFPFVFSVHNLSERQVYGTVANLKNTCLSISLFVGHFFIFICLCMFVCFFFFSKFLFFVLFSCVFEHSSF